MSNNNNNNNDPVIDLDYWRAVARELPGDWKVQAGAHDRYATLGRGDGLSLSLYMETYPDTLRGKVRIGVELTRAEYERMRFDESSPVVNVTPTRAASTVARDIERRLLPDAETFYATVRERVDAHAAYDARVEALRAQLAAMPALREWGDGDLTPRDSNAYGRVEPYDDRVRFEVTVPADMALRMVAAMSADAATVGAAVDGDGVEL